MNVNEALEFVDQRLCAKTGKHLNDIEKEVFVGSWHGRTYEEIYPQKPFLCGKDAGLPSLAQAFARAR